MKYIFLVGDGMQDREVKDLEGKTPLEVAKTPNMDYVAHNGRVGWVKTIPAGKTAGSDVAIMSLLGYSPLEFYTGRGPLEAANLGVELSEGDIAFRCNLVTVADDLMVDYSSGHILTKEADALIQFLNEKLASDKFRFCTGTSYRHLMVSKGIGANLKCTPPHDISGKKITPYLPQGEDEGIINDLMQKSRSLLSRHDVNHVRIDLKENPANMIWLWGQGRKPLFPNFSLKYGVKGKVISAVDLIKGMGRLIGLQPVNVAGATGYYDTNYEGKAEAALEILRNDDFVFIHVEAPDEAGHNGDLRAKISVIEKIDQLILGKILNYFKDRDDFRILVSSDHPTPVALKTHTPDPVFFAVFGRGIEKGEVAEFNERSARDSQWRFEEGHKLMDFFIKGE